MRPFSNKTAALLAALSLACLLPAYFLPFLSISQLGQERTFSLIGSVIALFREGNTFLGVVIGVFSVLFPLAKTVATLVAVSTLVNLSMNARLRLKKLVSGLGKYSMLDIFVVAVLVVAVKMEGLAEVRLLPGTVLFCISVLFALAASQSLKLAPTNEENTVTETTSPKQPAPGTARPAAFVISLLAAVAGAVLLAWPLGETVTSIELTKRQELDLSLSELFDDPDYYLILHTADGEELTTETFDNKLIGNGIVWAVEEIELDTVTEASVWDANLLSDTMLDRVYVHGRENKGQHYYFRFKGPAPLSFYLGIGLLGGGGLGLTLLLGGFIRRHTI